MPETFPLTKVCGGDLTAVVEQAPQEDMVDHVWITLNCGIASRVIVAVNTWSRRNAAEGFDGRIRMGILRGRSEFLPPRGASPMTSFHYEDWENEANIFYEHMSKEEAARNILDFCQEAEVLEAWGEHYMRHHQPGIHQVHSRRASCAVREDIRGQDGGLKFFRRDGHAFAWTMVFLKFCGQP